ncbi:MAG TPA: DUF547 domain-containing protein [Thermoanaerobaculia bacterium]|nr:DUF547 domain-containing protein [Thermoanaerobaculia bacterium]
MAPTFDSFRPRPAHAGLHHARSRAAWLLSTPIAACLLLGCGPKAEAVGGEIGEQVEQAIASGTEGFDHATWNALLATTVVDGFVDYAQMRQRRGELDSYLERIASVELAALSRDHLMALLINAYNAYTVTSILDHPGVESIRDIDGVWKVRLHRVGGFEVTLDDIEHGLLRPYFEDPRIHVAVNCASWSCPPLPPWAFDGARLDAQLEEWTRAFFADPENATMRDGKLWLSRILDWYGGDFTAPDAQPRADTLAAFVVIYAPTPLRAAIEEAGGDPPIEFFEYDWSLNDAARLRRP